MLMSQMCKRDVLTSPPFVDWAQRMRPAWDEATTGAPILLHRKLWEWLFITQALFERGVLREGCRGLGFGVGQEPLVSLFASFGCSIVATDMPADDAERQGWTLDNNFSGQLEPLNKYDLCDPEGFRSLVSFRTVDMKAIPEDLRGFDFTWSACAFEHLGSIDEGLNFMKQQMRCLRRGGVAVHTTEFNVDSARRHFNVKTIEEGKTVLFRRRDLQGLGHWLHLHGNRVALDFRQGTTDDDRHVDVPPFSTTHLRTEVSGIPTTSFGLIVRKGIV